MDNNTGLLNSHFKQYAFTWKPAFAERQPTLYRREDTKHIQGGPTTSREDIINRFINNECIHDPDRYLYRQVQVSGFLKIADLDILRGRPSSLEWRPMALLDDRNNEGVDEAQRAGNRRAPHHPLNALELYQALIENRFNEPLDGTRVDRRLIYIADLDPYCALGLVVTVSVLQAVFLRDFIQKYLAYRTMIGVDIYSPSPTGYSTFALEFHLPHYAWRRMPSMATDSRISLEETEEPLRRSERVIRLETAKEKTESGRKMGNNSQVQLEHDYIYEAQISVMVTGIDDSVWTAYCFADVYFKGGVAHQDTLEYYSSPDFPWDPHSCGKYPADRPIWLPREYFLRTLSSRIDQVKEEWNNAVFKLIQQIYPCIYSFTRGETDLGESGLEVTQQTGFIWTIRVLRQFTHLLSKTIRAWDVFKSGQLRYFYLPNSDTLAQASWGRYLADIEKDVRELEDLRDSLQHQTELFENMTNTLVTHAAHAETIITRIQSGFIQALTVITIFFIPPSLASGIFSMQSSILPKDVKFNDWLSVLVGLFILTAILVLLTMLRSVKGWKETVWNKILTFLNFGASFGNGEGKPREAEVDDGIKLEARERPRRSTTSGQV